ncbi:hypothetical protein HMPREF1544_04238 [Mucor circinelloides 1006PhL]|uniref:Uncharacterized protein n=1 Tax=Mucor circinelloides f. circinelloides (strain 1006PhL) TaxID=1220926 RepID=S2JKG2_MUCC1|nr:hypothetical protein HMPREF1544_04238 [Mucor circinelloides 1006PhL]
MKICTQFICLIWTISLVFASSASNVDLSNTFLLQTNDNNQSPDVDVNRFTQLLSNHLLFDHFDKAYLQLSRKISFQFRDAIQVKVKKIKSKGSSSSSSSSSTSSTSTAAAAVVAQPPVDVQILKRQLKGAVGSFVEDKLPAILTNRYNTTSLQNQLDDLLFQYCPSFHTNQQRTVSHQCLLNNRELFLQDIYSYTTYELQSTLLKVNEFDLPRLFEKTRAQISGILIHFNQHTLDKNHHRLELKIKASKAPTVAIDDTSLSLPPSYYDNNKFRNWITPEMILDFITTVTHSDNEEDHTIQHFIDLSM